MRRMSFVDFHEFRDVGVFRDDVEYDRGMLVAPDGTQLRANFDDPEQRAADCARCLGERLRNGVRRRRRLLLRPESVLRRAAQAAGRQRRLFAMRGISFVNELYGHEWELKVAQRRHARFVNTTMMVTGLGAAVSDALEDGRVVSGVGGQYNFVAMAHALPEARSILCVRATRESRGEVTSSIPWSYGHTTIPRHLRDIVVTEYGIADLRGRTDREVVEALLGVMDSRFQEASSPTRSARASCRATIGSRCARGELSAMRCGAFRALAGADLFAELPFGSDITPEEVVLARRCAACRPRRTRGPARSAALRALLADHRTPDGSPIWPGWH